MPSHVQPDRAPEGAHHDASARPARVEARLEDALAETLRELASPGAQERLDADPYWPKWDGPWWRMLLLHELGLAREIPPAAVEGLASAVARHYLREFPFRIEDVPAGVDPHRQVACHCQLGNVYQVLFACGVDVDARLPWLRPWFLRYQLADGALNCDEAAYLRPVPRGSLVSTLPPLEAVLRCTPRPFTPEEERFLDRGAGYLIERRLWRSLSRGGAVMDPTWARPCFPRFYFYDLLRGLSFLAGWAVRRARPLPLEAMREALEVLRGQVGADGALAPGRVAWAGAGTLRREASGGWGRGEARSFPLLEAVSATDVPSPRLAAEWREVQAAVARAGAR